MRVGAVIVAAGMSTRMKDFKQLLKIGELTFAERVIVNFQRAGIEEVVMVTGYRASQLEEVVAQYGITLIRNNEYKTTQMLDSAKMGFRYLVGRCDRVFFCPVDVPFFSENTVKEMLSKQGKLVFPSCNCKTGHPIRIDMELIPSILEYSGEGGLKGALDHLGILPTLMKVKDEGVITDADTPEEYQNLMEIHNSIVGE